MKELEKLIMALYINNHNLQRLISKPFVIAQIRKQIWKAQGIIRISYAICPINLLHFTTGGRLNAPDALKVVHIVSLNLQ
jgi:hypothetical protein